MEIQILKIKTHVSGLDYRSSKKRKQAVERFMQTLTYAVMR